MGHWSSHSPHPEICEADNENRVSVLAGHEPLAPCVEGPAGAGRVLGQRPPHECRHQRPTLQHDWIQFLGGGGDHHRVRAPRALVIEPFTVQSGVDMGLQGWGAVQSPGQGRGGKNCVRAFDQVRWVSRPDPLEVRTEVRPPMSPPILDRVCLSMGFQPVMPEQRAQRDGRAGPTPSAKCLRPTPGPTRRVAGSGPSPGRGPDRGGREEPHAHLGSDRP